METLRSDVSSALCCRDTLIDQAIERAVQRMQSVIELGRVVRDRKTLPVKVILQFTLSSFSVRVLCILCRPCHLSISVLLISVMY